MGCEPEEHAGVTTALRVTLTAPDSVELLQALGTVSMQCLTNKLTWTTDRWDSLSVTFPEVTRGPYSLAADGKVAVRINGGRRRVYRFRAADSYVEVLERPSHVKAHIQLFR